MARKTSLNVIKDYVDAGYEMDQDRTPSVKIDAGKDQKQDTKMDGDSMASEVIFDTNESIQVCDQSESHDASPQS